MNTLSNKIGFVRHLLAALALTTTLGGATVTEAQLDPHANEAAAVENTATGVVNLNTATEAELIRLPGIGPSKAQAILRVRQQRGSFRRIEDLMSVRGIGRKTFRKLQPMLSLQGPTTL